MCDWLLGDGVTQIASHIDLLLGDVQLRLKLIKAHASSRPVALYETTPLVF